MHRARCLITDSAGSTAMEYALVAALITMVIIGALGEIAAALVGLPLPALVDAFQSVLS